jgi:hypothetical protein
LECRNIGSQGEIILKNAQLITLLSEFTHPIQLEKYVLAEEMDSLKNEGILSALFVKDKTLKHCSRMRAEEVKKQ